MQELLVIFGPLLHVYRHRLYLINLLPAVTPLLVTGGSSNRSENQIQTLYRLVVGSAEALLGLT